MTFARAVSRAARQPCQGTHRVHLPNKLNYRVSIARSEIDPVKVIQSAYQLYRESLLATSPIYRQYHRQCRHSRNRTVSLSNMPTWMHFVKVQKFTISIVFSLLHFHCRLCSVLLAPLPFFFSAAHVHHTPGYLRLAALWWRSRWERLSLKSFSFENFQFESLSIRVRQ